MGLIHMPINPSYLIFRAILSTAAFDWAQTNIFIFLRFFRFLSYYRAIIFNIDSVLPVPGGPWIKKIPAECWNVFLIAAICEAFLLWMIWVYTFEFAILRYFFLYWISASGSAIILLFNKAGSNGDNWIFSIAMYSFS